MWHESDLSNVANFMTTLLWAYATMPVILDTLFTIVDTMKVEFVQVLGPITDDCAGVLLTGFGIATGVIQVVEGKSQGYTGWNTANSIVLQLARAFGFLILDQDNSTAPISLGALMSMMSLTPVPLLSLSSHRPLEG